jgi:hypothetical protein
MVSEILRGMERKEKIMWKRIKLRRSKCWRHSPREEVRGNYP